MTKDISVQEMQEHFADHIEEVRNGVTLRLIDGDKFVAEISPTARRVTTTPEDMIYRHAHGSMADFVPPPPIESDVDIVAVLREDRDSR
jgi:antitoxin (DNA-binding transcriptional repressor) of toxin-antitoxin stability system